MRCLILIPTYNEAATLAGLLSTLSALRPVVESSALDVLIIDDNSPDGTADVVRAHEGFGDWLSVLVRTSKEGLGSAYRAGSSAALAGDYDAVVQMDADGSHPAAEIPAMLALLGTHDVVLGSRYVRGGATVNWPLRRRVLSWCANAYARRMLGLSTRDATAGFRAWRTEALIDAGVLRTTSNGYGFQIENTWRCERLGLRVVEHPITFTERTAGVSKMSPAVAAEAAALVLRWRIGERAMPSPARSKALVGPRG
ncbi:polyprenol monophosphomannose synthase [Nocardioides sp. NBC_00850]|uniref:polyprenol monophosphomannose synthase n=1 Tax=Nocardioides sp. NBC_00850 TaxID=2976001 RepID=UPI0038708BB3|nr:polyprenol monophosphomannose synthase [Nocardioides sp. NBC_00850]